MITLAHEEGPFPFTQDDLAPDRLAFGVEHTLADFALWRDSHPKEVADHVNGHTEALEATVAEYSFGSRLRRRVVPYEGRAYRDRKLAEEVGFFCVYNMAEMPSPDAVNAFCNTPLAGVLTDEKVFVSQDIRNGLLSAIETNLPALRGAEEVPWLGEQLQRLGRILPEHVLREGGLGKAAMLIASILTIATYDTIHEPEEVQRQHLRRIIPAAYAYGATYPIIDDTLEDGNYVSVEDRERYHQTILQGLRTGEAIDISRLPDHPLAEELERAYHILLGTFSFKEYRNLYYAGESMFLAQERDSNRTAEDVALGGLESLYPDIFVKAAMTRIVANIIGQRRPKDGFYARAINATFLNQFRDDLFDRRADQQAGNITPFTYGADAGVKSLYDLFAYSAYMTSEIFAGDPSTSKVLVDHNAAKLAVYLHADRELSERVVRSPETTIEIARFVLAATGLSRRMVKSPSLLPRDVRLQKDAIKLFEGRRQTDIDPRTFVSDRVAYINQVIGNYYAERGGPLDKVARYTLESGGKRLRPALTLMLAEGLGVDCKTVEPLLVAIEQYHTASLIFDDLPAQDNSAERRGRPTAHILFGEANAQLAGIAMLSQGFGQLNELAKYYPADVALKIVDYFGTVMGPEGLCRGQELDLRMEREGRVAEYEEIIEMYKLKTSTLIEAALVPLMMLKKRPMVEIESIRKYAYHAGVAFQIRDDILDLGGDPDLLGKDVGSDEQKINIARQYGLAEAEKAMHMHLDAAVACCQALPFNTKLLEGIVSHFVTRNR
ncbi:MAG TPA: polyprenyl synthetase family protein [Candidatus Saccharimonadia bacterium]|nr:polyprenyl synthetase family protein [Candidatus Saccharimonadia bacterium]